MTDLFLFSFKQSGLAQNKEFHETTDAKKNEDCLDQKKSNSTRVFCAAWSGDKVIKSHHVNGFQFYMKNNQWFLQGVESDNFVQKQDCEIKQFSIFSNIGKFQEWIQAIVKRDTDRVFKDVELKCTFVRNVE